MFDLSKMIHVVKTTAFRATFFLNVVAILAITLTSSGCSTIKPHQVLQAGKYTIPKLSGWQQESYTGDFQKTITQSTYINGTHISIEFLCFVNTANVKPSTSVQELSTEVKSEEQSISEVSADLHFTSQTLVSTPSQYRNWPAYLTVRRKMQRGKISEAKILRFTDGQNVYWFQYTVGGKTIDPQAKSTADQAWTTLTNGLSSAPDTSRFAYWLPIVCLVIAITAAIGLVIFFKSRSKYKMS